MLTVVFVGLAFSRQGRNAISPEVFHFLHEFWETLGYLANTVIFVLTGVVILYNTNFAALELWDIAVCALVYVGATVVRCGADFQRPGGSATLTPSPYVSLPCTVYVSSTGTVHRFREVTTLILTGPHAGTLW